VKKDDKILTIVVAVFEVNMQENNISSLALANVEALAQKEIDYNVPDKSNDPKACTLEMYFSAGAEIEPGKYTVKAGYHKVAGIKNTCRKGSAGCDPYNCHKRI
jgi:hypothetical protein